jgi:hypothetical protein
VVVMRRLDLDKLARFVRLDAAPVACKKPWVGIKGSCKRGKGQDASALQAQSAAAHKAAQERKQQQQAQRKQTGLAVVDRAKKRAQDKPVVKRPKGIAEISPHDLHFDPQRFQYKLAHGATGASGSLSGVRKWDETLGGVLQVWRDPKDGKDYVVNGHNRAAKARELGAEQVTVRYLQVATAKEARAIGALTNIAEGRGNSMDAAKFFRDSGITKEELEAKGIPMREKIATDGLALSRLAPHLFDKVVHGDMPIERAIVIGDRLPNHKDQQSLVDLIDKEAKRGRKLTNDVVRELADTVTSAGTKQESLFDLFGSSTNTRNLALEKAELTAAVRQRLSREKKLFGVVSKSQAAEDLARAGNVINTQGSKDVSENAARVLNVFDQLKNQSGPVSSALNAASERIANGEDPKKVRDDLHKHLLQEIPRALRL